MFYDLGRPIYDLGRPIYDLGRPIYDVSRLTTWVDQFMTWVNLLLGSVDDPCSNLTQVVMMADPGRYGVTRVRKVTFLLHFLLFGSTQVVKKNSKSRFTTWVDPHYSGRPKLCTFWAGRPNYDMGRFTIWVVTYTLMLIAFKMYNLIFFNHRFRKNL